MINFFFRENFWSNLNSKSKHCRNNDLMFFEESSSTIFKWSKSYRIDNSFDSFGKGSGSERIFTKLFFCFFSIILFRFFLFAILSGLFFSTFCGFFFTTFSSLFFTSFFFRLFSFTSFGGLFFIAFGSFFWNKINSSIDNNNKGFEWIFIESMHTRKII